MPITTYQEHLKEGWKNYLRIFIDNLSIKEVPPQQQSIIDKCFKDIESGNIDSVSFELVIHRLVYELDEHMIVWKMFNNLRFNQLLVKGPLHVYLNSLPSIKTCLNEIKRLFGAILEPSYSLISHQKDNSIIIETQELVGSYLASDLKFDTGLCMVLYSLRELVGNSFDFDTFYIPNKRLSFNIEEASHFSNAKIIFHDGPMLASFDKSKLQMSNQSYNPRYSSLLKNQVNDLLISLNSTLTISEKTKKYILNAETPARQTIDSVAFNFGISQATFRRKLNLEGACFKDIHNEILKNIYLEALISTNISIDDLTLKLGYSERSSFERAFVREFGITPYRYRKKHQLSMSVIN